MYLPKVKCTCKNGRVWTGMSEMDHDACGGTGMIDVEDGTKAEDAVKQHEKSKEWRPLFG